MEFGIRFGAMSEPIKTQIEKQNLKCSEEECDSFERTKKAIFQLLITDTCTDREADKMYLRLHKAVTKHICETNMLQAIKIVKKA
jgi:hypothetical protein